MIIWRQASNPLFIGLLGFLGKYQIFSISEDLRKRTSREKSLLKLQYTLPGLINTLYGFDSTEEAVKEAEQIFNHWLSEAGLISKEKETKKPKRSKPSRVSRKLLPKR